MSLQVWLPLNGNINNQGLTQLNYTTQGSFEYIENGKIGKAISSGQIIMSAENMQNIFSKGECSICFWIYVNAETGSTATSDRPMLFGNNLNRRYSLFQYPTCNDFHFSWWKNDQGNTESFSNVCANAFPSYTWTHAAITYKNKTVTIYINGQKKLTDTRSYDYSPVSLNYDTILFSNNNNKRYLNDYRIYDHCLSQKEIEEISKGLVLHYPLNNHYLAENNTIYDTSGYSYNGTIVGNLNTAAPSPRYNCCIEHLDSCADYIYRPHLSFLGNSGFTFSCWINPSSYSRTNGGTTAVGNQYILSQGRDYLTSGTDHTYGASLTMNNGKVYFVCGSGSLYSNTTVSIGEWAHVVGVWTGTQKKIYINGVLKNSENDNRIDWSETSNRLTIGKMAYGSSSTTYHFPFVGKISDVRIYATALTDNQIKELYNTSMSVDSSGNVFARELVEE